MGLSPGTRLGPYEIVSPIGAGGMGEVYRARDTRLGRDVAIKVLPAAAALDPDRLARFDREARLLASLNHPHIATLHGIEHCDGVRALVLELVEGDTLADIVARGPVPVREALRLAGQIADALDAAHAKGVIHRDLKPANIKVTPQRQIKVLDFGLAKAFAPSGLDADLSQLPTVTSDGTREGLVIGTAAYMSPGTGARPGHRQAHGHLGVRLRALRDADRPASVRGRDEVGHDCRDPPPGAGLVRAAGSRCRLTSRVCFAAASRKIVARRLRDIGNTRADLDESVAAGARAGVSREPARSAHRPGWCGCRQRRQSSWRRC